MYLRPKSATLPRKALQRRHKKHLTASNDDLLADCQTKPEVQTYIVPQLYSLYRYKIMQEKNEMHSFFMH